jgi:hypothetical protein
MWPDFATPAAALRQQPRWQPNPPASEAGLRIYDCIYEEESLLMGRIRHNFFQVFPMSKLH